MEWFEETLHPDWRQRMRVTRVLFRERTEHQDLVIFETPTFGRVLALDGVVQTTEADEFIYHEALVHTPIVGHGAAREVLIVGGGDGGSLREALKHEGVERVTQVEIDRGVIDLCREHLPSLGAGAFDHPRARVVIADGARWVAETEDRYDVVIVDSTDPLGPGEMLFTEAFYGGCKRVLRPGGVLATQGGNPFCDQGAQLRRGCRRLAPHFADVAFYTAAIPSYVGGLMAFGWASDDPAKRHAGAELLAGRGIPSGLRHYGAPVHAASFVHAPWLLGAASGG
jgi:spermidine synthase